MCPYLCKYSAIKGSVGMEKKPVERAALIRLVEFEVRNFLKVLAVSGE